MVFVDRRDAGRRLADLLAPFARERPIVLALPRGGVPVAVEVARALDAPLDVLAVRKLGAPENPEFAIGAVAEDGTGVVAAEIARMGISQEEIDRILAREGHELRRRMALFRTGRAPRDLTGLTVIIVDDGMATGLTDLAAVRAVRARGAARIVVAVPVASREAIAMLRQEADEVVSHSVPTHFLGVGRWYRDFRQVSDDEVLALLAEAAAAPPSPPPAQSGAVVIEAGDASLRADLSVPPGATGLVIFAHGSGSSRLSPRNRMVAARLEEAGLATLLLDLLSEDEEGRRDLVFDIALLARRLEAAARWAAEGALGALPLGFFGASTGAAAALRAAAALGDGVRAVVSRGGRPDLAGDRLPDVRAATLLIVGSRDEEVERLNRAAADLLRCPHLVEVIEGAGHLFEEPGTLEAVAALAIDWFRVHLSESPRPLTGAREA